MKTKEDLSRGSNSLGDTGKTKIHIRALDVFCFIGGVMGVVAFVFTFFTPRPNVEVSKISTFKIDSLTVAIENIEYRQEQLDKEYIKHIDSLYNAISEMKER